MKQRCASPILAVLMVGLCLGCKVELYSKYTCLWEANDNMTLASGGGDLACGEVLLHYDVENNRILTGVEPDEQHALYLPNYIGDDFPNHGFWSSFSEAELDQIENEHLLQRHYGPGATKFNAYTLTLPAISTNNFGHAFVITSFCTYSDEGLIIENPISGKPALIQDIEYVKFKGSPLIQLPLGAEDGEGVIVE